MNDTPSRELRESGGCNTCTIILHSIAITGDEQRLISAVAVLYMRIRRFSHALFHIVPNSKKPQLWFGGSFIRGHQPLSMSRSTVKT